MIEENKSPGKAGGMRANSHEIHRLKKVRKFKCEWCKKDFESSIKHARFCSPYHRLRGFQIDKAYRERKKLTHKARKLRGFRPPSYRINTHNGYITTTRRSKDAKEEVQN